MHDLALRALCLCDGYGGFELGFRLAGLRVRTVARCERDSFAASVLVARMEEQRLDQAPLWDDLVTFDGPAWRGRVDIITAGFPCQPFSVTGEQLGIDDERWIWPDIARIIADVGPRYVFLENVPGLVRLGLPHVLSDLAELGFDADWGSLAASGVGAPHERDRIWILAHTEGARQQEPSGRRQRSPRIARPAGCGSTYPPRPGDACGWDIYDGPQPSVRRCADGRPAWLAPSLHLGGNGLVPLAAAHAFNQLTERAGIDMSGYHVGTDRSST